jgi:uncharacterized membrane protein
MGVGEPGSRLRKLDAFTSAAVRFAFFCVWPTLVAIALGATLFAATHADLLPAMFDNKLTPHQRWVGLGFFAASLGAVAAFYVGVLLYRHRDHWPPGFDRAARLHPYLSFVLSGPAIVALTEPKIETQHQWRAWLYIALAVLAWWPTLRALASDWPARRSRRILSDRQRDVVSLATVFALWAVYAYVFANIAINTHHAFQMRMVDLGIYDNVFFQSSHGRPLGCSFLRGGTHATAHFDPILVILSPLYLLWPRAEFLLTLQAVWCGAGVIPVYLIGRQQLGSRVWGLVWALVYALHPALHGANLYEFHSLTLLLTPALFALYFLLSGKLRLYYVMLAVMLLIREDVPLLLCFVGLYALISGEPGHKRAGWITILASLVYFVVAKTVFMSAGGVLTHGAGSYGYHYYYKAMIPNGLGELDIFTTLLTNPAFVVSLVAQKAKIHYLLVIFVPLLFLPAWGGRARVMLLYGLIFILLASRSAVYSTHFQYSAVLLPVAIALAPLGLRRLQEGRRKDRSLTPAIMGCVLVASLLVSWKHGAVLENSSFRGGFRPIVRTWTEPLQERYDSFLELVSQIELDASVSVTDRVGAHVTNRAEVHRLDQNIDTDYLLVDTSDLRGRNKASLERREEAGKVELVERTGRWRLYRGVP